MSEAAETYNFEDDISRSIDLVLPMMNLEEIEKYLPSLQALGLIKMQDILVNGEDDLKIKAFGQINSTAKIVYQAKKLEEVTGAGNKRLTFSNPALQLGTVQEEVE